MNQSIDDIINNISIDTKIKIRKLIFLCLADNVSILDGDKLL
jgi:hypothetical protein